jgi:hypothetical protein
MEEPTIPHYHYTSPKRTINFISPCIGKSKSSLVKSQGTFTVLCLKINSSIVLFFSKTTFTLISEFQIHHNQRLQRTHYLFDIQNDVFLALIPQRN